MKYTYKRPNGNRIRKHICEDCFVKLFPDSIEDKVKCKDYKGEV